MQSNARQVAATLGLVLAGVAASAQNGPVSVRQTRLLFAHHCAEGTQAGIDATLQRLRDANMNAIAPQVFLGYAYWPSRVALRWRLGGVFDPLGYLVERAHAAGVEVHCVFDCFWLQPPDYVAAWAPDDVNRAYEKRLTYRSQKLPEGACFHDPQYRRFFAAVVREVCTEYEVDGIVLDLIRTGGRPCVCADCVRSYAQRFGRDLLTDATRVGPEIVQWHRDGISALVQAVSDAARAVRPSVRRSICGYVPALQEPLQGQAPEEWIEKGWLDAVQPMTYWPKRESVLAAVRQYQQVLGGSERVFPLLSAVRTGGDTARFVALLEAVLREGRVPGVGIYYHRFLTDELAQALRQGPFEQRAAPSWPRHVATE